jgi:Domain of unknown function (DUF6265)
MRAARILLAKSVCAALLALTSKVMAQATSTLPAYIAGCWAQVDGDKRIEEMWMAPQGKLMLGVGRTLRADAGVTRVLGFEHMHIELTATGMDFVATPSGRATVRFALVKHEPNALTFGNPAHAFPSTVHYALAAPGELFAQISGQVQGQPRTVDFRYRRVACP